MLLFLLLGSLFLITTGNVWAESTSERQAKEAELAKLREQITLLRGELNQIRTRYDALQEELRDVDESLGQIRRLLRRLDTDIQTYTRRLDTLQNEQSVLEKKIDAQRDYLVRQIRAAHISGHQEYLKLLLNQENPATLGRNMAYYDYFNRARSQRITALLETVHELKSVRSEIERQEHVLLELRDEQEENLAELEKTRETRQQLLTELATEISDKDRRLQSMLTDEKELEKLIVALAQLLQDIPVMPENRQPFAQMRGKLPWPVKGKIQASFGSQRLGTLRWQGILLSAAEGTSVQAVSHGRVAFADWMRGFGHLLILDHGDGYMSVYGHNRELLREVGDWVSAGDPVGSAGNHPGNEHSGLYFEIRKNGKPQNPLRWLQR